MPFLRAFPEGLSMCLDLDVCGETEAFASKLFTHLHPNQLIFVLIWSKHGSSIC